MGANERARVVMSPDEVRVHIEESRTATMATVGVHGLPHLVAMWYGVIDGEVWFETKTKSQKVQNLLRDGRLSGLIERGRTTDQLRGVALEGRGEISADPVDLWNVCRSVYERYTGPYDERHRDEVEQMMYKRVAVRLVVERSRSWDHRKLDGPPLALAGTTAEFVDH